MKLSEMSTQQMAAALCKIAAPLSRIGQDEKINAFLSDKAAEDRKGRTQMHLFAEIVGSLVPVVLGEHFDDAVTVIAVMTGKEEQAVREQKAMQTVADVRAFFDEDFVSFFKSSAASTPTK